MSKRRPQAVKKGVTQDAVNLPSEFVAFPPREPEPRLHALLLESALYLVPVLLFLAIKTYAKAPCTGDENIYFYVGRRIAEGLMPYRDVFNAHPPGHLLVAAFFMSFGWFSPFIFKFIPTIAATGTILFTTALLRAVGYSRAMTALSALLCAFSLNMLMVSSHFTGASWSLMLMMAALLALWHKRRMLSGGLLAAAGLISFHIIPAIGAIALADLYFTRKEGPRKALTTGLTLAGVTIGTHLLFYALAGAAYAEQVFGYHLGKTPMGESGVTTTLRFFYDEYHLFGLAILGVIALGLAVASRRKHEERPRQEDFFWLVAFTAAMQILAILTAKRVFTYYLIPLVPPFVVLGTYALAWLKAQSLRFIAAWRADGSFGTPLLTLLGVLLLFSGVCAWGEGLETKLDYYKNDFGEVSHYNWEPSPLLPGFVDSAIRATLFVPDRRIGSYYPTLTRYLWHEFATDSPEPLLEEVKKLDSIPGKIFGDSSNTGYFALQTGRKVSLEMADTNSQIFKSGLLTMEELIKRLETDPPALVIANPKRGIGSSPEFVKYLKDKYTLAATKRLGKKASRLQVYTRNK